MPDYLELEDRRLAYHSLEARGEGARLPGIVFLGGLCSDMTGTKATFLEDRAREHGRGYLRFDYRGHGESSDTFINGAISDWADDAAQIIELRTQGRQVLVGSSMGGWVACLLAKRMPERIAGFVGVAAAPDFTEDSMWENFTIEQRMMLAREGHVMLPSDYGEPYPITRRLIEDGARQLVLREPLACPFPVRLLHGTADADVEPSVGLRLLEHVDCHDARLTLVKGADHRFSEPELLALIWQAVEEVSRGAEP